MRGGSMKKVILALFILAIIVGAIIFLPIKISYSQQDIDLPRNLRDLLPLCSMDPLGIFPCDLRQCDDLLETAAAEKRNGLIEEKTAVQLLQPLNLPKDLTKADRMLQKASLDANLAAACYLSRLVKRGR